jgi:hypothetical protein
MLNIRSAVHEFTDLENTTFQPADYSKLKFGCDATAKKFGKELAIDTFNKHKDLLLSKKIAVIPSAYNYVPNAASVMTKYFIEVLNHLVVSAGGQHVDYSLIHRKVSYINDYGFLTKERREELIANDKFHFDKGAHLGKLLIFTDDVRITGTHERKIAGMFTEDGITNDSMFLYYANYTGDVPEIEAKINFAAVKDVQDYIDLTKTPNHHVIVRPIKYILSRKEVEVDYLLKHLSIDTLIKVYNGALAEGYYEVPAYTYALSKLRVLVNNYL